MHHGNHDAFYHKLEYIIIPGIILYHRVILFWRRIGLKLVLRAVTVIAILSVICMSIAGCSKKVNTDVQTEDIVEEGKMLITVVDNESKEPVGDAKIVIAGIDNFFKTDDKGQSPEITLKVNKDIFKKYGAELFKKAPAGTVTIFVTKDGYKDCIVFNRPVYPGYSANNVNIQMSKADKNDSENYMVDIQYPHNLWIKELVEYCRSIKDENDGGGENRISVSIKGSNSKAVEGASIFIPELGIKVISDKNGSGVLKPGPVTDMVDVYPVKQQLSGYTVVVDKEGYLPAVVFNVAAGAEKEGQLNVVLKPAKSGQDEEYTVSSQPYDKDWLDKIISSYKEQEE